MSTVSNPLTQSDEQHRRAIWLGLIQLADLLYSEPGVVVPDEILIHLDASLTPDQLQAHTEATDAVESTTGAVDTATWSRGPVTFEVCAPRQVVA